MVSQYLGYFPFRKNKVLRRKIIRMTKEAVTFLLHKLSQPWKNKDINPRLKIFCAPLHWHSRCFCAFQGPLTFQIPNIMFLLDCLGELVGISKPKQLLSGWILELGPWAWLHPVWLTRLFPSKDGNKSFSETGAKFMMYKGLCYISSSTLIWQIITVFSAPDSLRWRS